MTAPATRTIDLTEQAPASAEQRDAYVALLEELTHSLVASERMRGAAILQRGVWSTAALLIACYSVWYQATGWRGTGLAAILTGLVALLLCVWIERRTAQRVRAAIGRTPEAVTIFRGELSLRAQLRPHSEHVEATTIYTALPR